MSENESSGQTNWNQAQFVGRIVKATNSHDISELELPQTVDLTGRLAEISDDLMKRTLDDPQKRERARVGIVGHDGKLRIDSKESVGVEKEVTPGYSTFVKLDWRGTQYDKDEYASLLIHTHGAIDVPPSPPDLVPLFIDIEDGGVHASIVITPSTRFLLLKTLQTPSRTLEEARGFVAKYDQRYKEAMNAEILSFRKHMTKFGGATEDSLERHANKTDPIVQINLLNEVCRENHIAIYTAINNSIYRRVKY